MKKMAARNLFFGLLMVSASNFLSSSTAQAAAIDNFYLADDGKRHFNKNPREHKGNIEGCGFILVSKLEDGQVAKIMVLSENKNDPEAPPEKNIKFSTHIEIQAGKVNEDSQFESYKLDVDKSYISGDWLSRLVRISEFPSDSLQLGGYFTRYMLEQGFVVNFSSSEFAEEKVLKITKQDLPEQKVKDFGNCFNAISSLNLFRWTEYYKLPPECFYDANISKCKK